MSSKAPAPVVEAVQTDPAPSVEVVQNPAVEAPTEPAAPVAAEEVVPESDDAEEASSGAPVREKSTPKAVQELITQRKKKQAAEAALAQAQQELAYYRGVAEGRGHKPEPVAPAPADPRQLPTAPPVSPTIEQFDTFEQYERAKDEYIVGLTEFRFAQWMRDMESQKAKMTAEEEFRRQHDSFVARVDAAASSDPELLTLLDDNTLPVSDTMAQVIRSSELGPQLMKWVHNNRKEGARIMSLSSILAARELGRIEAQLSSAPKPVPPKRVSAAPEPITPVAGASPGTLDESSLPIDQWVARRNKAEFRR